MQTNSQNRLLRDLKKLFKDSPEGIEAAPMSDDNIFVWEAVIFGPDDTAWQNGIFNLEMTFSNEYPTKPPKVVFKTEIFHPNVYKNGNICLDILQNNWSPIMDVTTILVSIQSLLTDPNPKSPANAEAARLYTDDRPQYYKRVKQTIEKTLENQSDDSDDGEEEEDED